MTERFSFVTWVSKYDLDMSFAKTLSSNLLKQV